MGGPGAGHKSVEATQARLANIQKARAARRRAPLPWRSAVESRIIEQLVWQWFLEVGCWRGKGSGEWLVTSGERKTKNSGPSTSLRASEWQVALRSSGQVSGARKTQNGGGREKAKADFSDAAKNAAPRNDTLPKERRAGRPKIIARPQERPAYAKAAAGKPWSKLRVARLLGVSHTWVNKLVKQFERDPERYRRRMAAFASASFEKLERAREETRRLRERGGVRGPIRYRRVKVTLQGRKQKVMVANQSEKQRREAEAKAPANLERLLILTPMRYAELPAWARGFVLPMLPETMTLRGTSMIETGIQTGSRFVDARMPVAAATSARADRPRPVKFARRHHRR